MSISSDPVGSGAPTFASGTRSCQKYPTSVNPPYWVQNITPDVTAGIQATSNVTGDFVLDPTEQWFTGTHVVGGVTQPFVWFSPDGDDYADATGTGGSTLPGVHADQDLGGRPIAGVRGRDPGRRGDCLPVEQH